jgi:hypothetical protein
MFTICAIPEAPVTVAMSLNMGESSVFGGFRFGGTGGTDAD